MPGLTSQAFEAIRADSHSGIVTYLKTFQWQRIVVLTLSNIPGTLSPRASSSAFVEDKYPLFKRNIEIRTCADVTDFWVVERGGVTNRIHMNVLLTSAVPITETVVREAWECVAVSNVWQDTYEPALDNGYWTKELVSPQADVLAYGGSVVFPHPETVPVQTKPRRKTKSAYNRERVRRRYRSQDSRFSIAKRSFI